MKIAIDGPAGAGKSTISKTLSHKLGFLYLDTGAMYRAVGLKMIWENVAFSDEAKVKSVLEKTDIRISHENGVQKVFLDGKDVSSEIREHHVSKAASDVSALPCVRLKMVEMQREIAENTDVILDGRDIGTYVLPNAEFKFFLTASLEERAKRRYEELCTKGMDCDLKKIAEDIRVRDYNDSHRDFAPLRKAEDAIEIDTTSLTIKEVADKMLEIINGKIK